MILSEPETNGILLPPVKSRCKDFKAFTRLSTSWETVNEVK